MSKELYKFEKLISFLKSEGIQIGEAKGYIPVMPEDVFNKQGKTDISFYNNNESGIYATDKQGIKHQVYMYKYRYDLDRNGMPRFHICQCSTIQTFMSRGKFGEYYFGRIGQIA